MTSQSVDTNLSIKAAVIIGTMANFDSELDGQGMVTSRVRKRLKILTSTLVYVLLPDLVHVVI